MYQAFFDGASQGNPGPSGIGYAIINPDGEIIIEQSKFTGTKTNNEAEYTALIFLLKELDKRNIKYCHIYGDSQLVISQVLGKWTVNKTHLYKLCVQARSLMSNGFSLGWIPREKNVLADKLSKKALEIKPDAIIEKEDKKITSINKDSNAHSFEPKEVFDGIFLIQSSDKEKIYVVDTYNEACSCPAFILGRTRPCKHMLAVEEHKLQAQLVRIQERKKVITSY